MFYRKLAKDNHKPKSLKRRLLIILPIVLVLFGFCWYQNKHIVVYSYIYWNNSFSEELDGFRIVQISDLHNVNFGIDNKRLLDKVRGLDPDIIVITGDIIDSNHTNTKRALYFSKSAVEICPVYFVTGNHEYWLDEQDFQALMSGLKDAGVIILDNEAVTVGNETSSFLLVGLDEKHIYDETLQGLLKNYDRNSAIVLAHEPQFIHDYAQSGAGLVLTGHAHGGQFRLPFIGGVIAPDQGFFPEYTAGVHNEGDTTMIISRVLGNSVIPIRLFNCPEIVCIDLKKE